jgi:serine/threonine protein kinase
MPISVGAPLGVYEILSVLGACGMGGVYRARDTRLGREAAIKVILAAFAADPDRVARFQREAKVLASLDHPHIAALYGLEQSVGQHFLVMELAKGRRSRIAWREVRKARAPLSWTCSTDDFLSSPRTAAAAFRTADSDPERPSRAP